MLMLNLDGMRNLLSESETLLWSISRGCYTNYRQCGYREIRGSKDAATIGVKTASGAPTGVKVKPGTKGR